jgi:hypothetical protein
MRWRLLSTPRAPPPGIAAATVSSDAVGLRACSPSAQMLKYTILPNKNRLEVGESQPKQAPQNIGEWAIRHTLWPWPAG